MGKSADNTNTEEEWGAGKWQQREMYRNQLRKIILDANKDGKKDKAAAGIKLLNGDDLEYTFDELHLNKDYVGTLYRGYNRKNDKNKSVSLENTKELIESDFEFWNRVRDGSLVLGGINLVDVMANYDENEKADMLRRLKTYDKVDALGTGSRPFLEQLAGVGTGVGVDVVATGGIGTVYKILTKPVSHKIEGKIIESALSPQAKMASISATYGGGGDIERQALELEVGAREDYSIPQTITTTGISAIAPKVAEKFGQGLGYVTRPIQNIPTSFAILAKSMGGKDWVGKFGSSQKLQEAFDLVGLRGVDMKSGSAQLSFNLKNTWKNINNAFSGQYKNLNLTIKPIELESIINKWKNSRLPMLDGVTTLMEKLKPTYRRMSGYGSGKGSTIASSANPAETLRSIKKILWDAADDIRTGRTKKYDSSQIKELNALRRELINLEDKAAFRAGKDTHIQYRQLKDDFGKFEDMKGTDMGRTIRDIVQKKSHESTDSAEKLAHDMVSGDFAWNKFNMFVDSVEKFGNIEGRKGVVKTIRGDIQNSVGYFLTQKNGKKLVELMETPDGRGMDILKGLYPDDVKLWKSIESFAKKLDKTAGKSHASTGSVIANMVTARLGSKLGEQVGGQTGSVVGTLLGIPLVNSLLKSKFFQNAMVNAINNKGRLPVAGHNWLKKQGLNKEQIYSIQDTILGLPFAGFSIGNVEEIWDKSEGAIDARIEEIRKGFLF
jgi:hypothetical protein